MWYFILWVILCVDHDWTSRFCSSVPMSTLYNAESHNAYQWLCLVIVNVFCIWPFLLGIFCFVFYVILIFSIYTTQILISRFVLVLHLEFDLMFSSLCENLSLSVILYPHPKPPKQNVWTRIGYVLFLSATAFHISLRIQVSSKLIQIISISFSFFFLSFYVFTILICTHG